MNSFRSYCLHSVSSSPVSGTCSWSASLFPFLPVGAKSYRGYIFSGEWVICCRMRAVVRRAYSVREEAEIIERYGELEKQDYLREWTVKNKLGI